MIKILQWNDLNEIVDPVLLCQFYKGLKLKLNIHLWVIYDQAAQMKWESHPVNRKAGLIGLKNEGLKNVHYNRS